MAKKKKKETKVKVNNYVAKYSNEINKPKTFKDRKKAKKKGYNKHKKNINHTCDYLMVLVGLAFFRVIK